MKNYYTHDNGGRPFKVCINDKFVNVSMENYDEWSNNHKPSYEPLVSYIADKIFIDNENEYIGSSILLKVNDKYIYIGTSIYSFESYEEIIKLVSKVGNSDVVYPYAIDKLGNYYLLIENVVVQNVPDDRDPYDFYYHRQLITPDRGYLIPKQPVDNLLNISKYSVNDEQYTLTWCHNPNENYDRLAPKATDKMYIFVNDHKIELSKEKYIDMMDTIAKHRNFKTIKNVEIIQPRDF